MSSVSGYSLKHLENAKNDIGTQRAALGFFLVFVLLFSGTCAGLLLEDKKSKTFMRYFLAPVKEFEVFLGTFIMCIAFGTVQILLFLGITRYVFNFDWKIHWAYVFILLITFLITSIGISMSILAFTRDVRMYSLANAGISLFSCFISGAFFSSSLMGETLDKISNIFPQKWVMSAFESLVNGQSLPDIQNNLIILLLYGAILFIIGIRTLHPSEIDL
jgi:ABC-2 type transport system permease protein